MSSSQPDAAEPGAYLPFAQAAAFEGIPSSFAAARDGIDAVLRDRGLRRTTPEDTAASLALGAAASARLDRDADEAPTPPVTPGAAAGDPLSDLDDEPLSRDLARLYGELLALVPIWKRSPMQALARMHALAAGSLPEEMRGRPASGDGARALQSLAAEVAGVGPQVPGLVVAALVHGQLATAGAFGSFDMVVARAAERLVLVATGVDPASVLVPEAAHLAEPEGYRGALAAFARRTPSGTVQWLNYSSMVLARSAAVSPLAR